MKKGREIRPKTPIFQPLESWGIAKIQEFAREAIRSTIKLKN
jgi:hypothetical protein